MADARYQSGWLGGLMTLLGLSSPQVRTLDRLIQVLSQQDNLLEVNRNGDNIAHLLLQANIDDQTDLKASIQHLLSLPQGSELFRAKNSQGRTPLLVWFQTEHKYFDTEIIEMIVNKSGVDINARDADGNTMFLTSAAINENSLACLKSLKKLGADHTVTNNDGQNALTIAANNDSVESVKYLVSLGVSLNHQNSNGYSPLLKAALALNIDVIKYLISQNPNVLTVNYMGCNVAHLLVITKRDNQAELKESIKYLISLPQAHAIFKMTNRLGQTPLHSWICSDNLLPDRDMVEAILKISGENVDATDRQGHTLFLNVATKPNSIPCLDLLKRLGANINAPTSKGQNALNASVLFGHLDIVKYLVSIHVSLENPDEDGDTPILQATICQHFDIIEYLVEQQANLNAVNNDGNNIAHLLLKEKCDEISTLGRCIKKLISTPQGRKLFEMKNKVGKTPLQCWRQSDNSPANIKNIEKVIIEFPQATRATDMPKVGATTEFQQNIRHIAVQRNTHSPEIDRLKDDISQRGSVLQVNNNGENIAHTLLLRDQDDTAALKLCVDYLISLPEGKELFKRRNNRGQTPLFVYIAYGNGTDPELIEMILKTSGEHVDANDAFGHTMFLCAAMKQGSIPCLKLLKRFGANINATVDDDVKDEDANALHKAAAKGYVDTAEYLLSIGVTLEKQDIGGDTPLLQAAISQQFDMVKYLIMQNANMLAVNNNGNNIAHLLLKYKYDDTTALKDCMHYLLRQPGGRRLLATENTKKQNPLQVCRESGNSPANIKTIETVLHNFMEGTITTATDLASIGVDKELQENHGNIQVLHPANSPEIDWFKDYISQRGNVSQVNEYGNNIAHQLLIRKQEDQDSLPHLIMYLASLPERREIFSTKNKQNKTPLRVWIESENLLPDPETIKKILQVSGENLEEVDAEGCTMFLAAAKKPDALDCLKCLKDLGADHTVTYQSGGNALHLAALNGILHSVKYFVSIGLLPNDKDNNGDTPLHLAACWQNIEVMKYLIEVGANVLAADNDGDNVAHMLLQRKNDDPTAIKRGMHYLTTLRQARDLFNTRNDAIKTPLQLWMAPSRVDHPLPVRETIIKILQTSREDINAEDVYGYTMFLNAVSQSDCVECLRCLKDLGANKDALNSSKRNILHISAMEGKLEAVKYAVSIGFDLEQMDIYGYTPLLLAAMEQQVDVLQYLIGQQANILAVARNGDNIAHLLSFRIRDRPQVELGFRYLRSHPQGRRLFQMENKKGITPRIRAHSWD